MKSKPALHGKITVERQKAQELQPWVTHYKDISKRMRGEGNNGSLMPQDQCLDLLIVVNMLLTGFDSRILNTLSPYRRSRKKKEPLGKAKQAGRGETGKTASPPRLSHVD